MIKLSEDNIREYMYGLRLGKNFFNKIQKVQTIQEKMNKFDFIKIKSSLHQKTL